MRLRERLAARKPVVHSRHTVRVDGEAVEVEIVRATAGARAELFRAAVDAGELDADGKPANSIAALSFAARALAVLLHEGGERAFPGDDGARAVMELDEFGELAKAAQEALAGEDSAVTQGNSDAPAPPATDTGR